MAATGGAACRTACRTTIAAVLVAAGVIGTVGSLAEAATPAAAAGPTITVSPLVNVSRAGRSFVVKGSGFSTTANGGAGIYVTFGPKPSLHPTDFFTNIAYYQASVWVHPTGSPNSATNKPMNPDGSFSFTLTNADGSTVKPTYGSTDCTRIQCGVLTMAAHGSTNRTQDTFRPVIFTTPDPTAAKVGIPYSSRVAPAGVSPYTWKVKTGPLPPGLRLNARTGVISGTPTTEGVFRPTVEVADSTAPTPQRVNRALLIRVAPRNIVIAPATLPGAVRGGAYSRRITASGGLAPYRFKVTAGALPPGITLSATGLLSGTPTVRGTYAFTVRAADKLAFTRTRAYTLKVT